MAFPTSPVLDDFNSGASQNLTARAGWGTSAFPTSGAGWATDVIPSFATANVSTGNNWGVITNADNEAYVNLKTFNPATQTMEIHVRIQGFTVITSYALVIANSAATDLQIYKYIGGAKTALGTNTATTFTSGDGYGISAIGTAIVAWYRSGIGGTWVVKNTISDSSVTGAGGFGFRGPFASGGIAIDEFGGGVPGSLVTATARPKQIIVPRTWARA